MAGGPCRQGVSLTAHDAGYSAPTVDALAGWGRAFILFHDKRHPDTLDRGHVAHFHDHVVRTEPDPLPALEMARLALMLLYRTVLAIDLGELAGLAPWPRRREDGDGVGLCRLLAWAKPGWLWCNEVSLVNSAGWLISPPTG